MAVEQAKSKRSRSVRKSKHDWTPPFPHDEDGKFSHPDQDVILWWQEFKLLNSHLQYEPTLTIRARAVGVRYCELRQKITESQVSTIQGLMIKMRILYLGLYLSDSAHKDLLEDQPFDLNDDLADHFHKRMLHEIVASPTKHIKPDALGEWFK